MNIITPPVSVVNNIKCLVFKPPVDSLINHLRVPRFLATCGLQFTPAVSGQVKGLFNLECNIHTNLLLTSKNLCHRFPGE